MDRLLPTVLITGASSGIGRDLARVFAENHYQLILVARSRDSLESLAAELHHDFLVPARVEACDLADRAAVNLLIDRLSAENLVIDVLVNNAGFGIEGAFTVTDGAGEREMIEVNVSALVRLTKAFLPQMVNRRSGRILQVASTAAFQPGPYLSVYFATKAFVLSFSEAIAAELKGSGVTVTALCPGPTHTGFEKRLGSSSGLFGAGLPVANSREVARYAYTSLLRGKRVAVHGWLNRGLALLSRVLPTGIALFFMRRAFKAGASGSRHSKNLPAA